MTLRHYLIILFLALMIVVNKCSRNFVHQKFKKDKLPFKIIEFKKSFYISEGEDFIQTCQIINTKKLDPNESINDWQKQMKETLDVNWFRWRKPNDLSFQLSMNQDCIRFVFRVMYFN